MPSNEYTPEQALQLLIEMIRERERSLADEVQHAIDEGKDVSETEPSNTRSKDRSYRKTVPFTHKEALAIVIDALQGYFVEHPLFLESALDNLANSAVGIPQTKTKPRQADVNEPEILKTEGLDEEKTVEFELQTETQLLKTGEETLPLKRVSRELITEQMRQIETLRKMTSFH